MATTQLTSTAHGHAYLHADLQAEDDVIAGLSAPHKRLPCRLLYDAAGANLFERITTVDEYYPTRTELDLLKRHLPQIAAQVGPRARVIEPGSGEGIKPRMLLSALDQPSAYVPIDVAHEQLQAWARAIRAEMPGLDVTPVTADYTRGFDVPTPQHDWGTSLVFFPGSTIGNFEPAEARNFLSMLGRVAGDQRMLLLGADATHDEDDLINAYDDSRGITAAFNKNVLAHLNKTRGATFDLDCFDHRAIWNEAASRIEMHLFSRCQQIVRIDGHTIPFTADESIVTEHCYKHSPEAMLAILAAGGWRPRQVFTAPDRPYRLWLCEPLTWRS